MDAARQIKLGMFLRPAGHHIAAWRHPDAGADGGLNFADYVEMARTAERGLFDLLFSADTLSGERYDRETLSRTSYVAWIEPMSLLTALAAVTRHIGLVCTGTTTYDEPYLLARRFASLELISGGRAGWNVVTSANARGAEFRREAHPAKAERYAAPGSSSRSCAACGTAGTTTPSCSTRPTAASTTRTSARARSPGQALQGARAAQRLPLAAGPPVIVQAGASDDGRELAAETAEVVFCAHQTIEEARAFYDDVKGRMAACGRDPDHLKIMPGLGVMVGRTRQEARDKCAAAAGPDPSRCRRRAAVEVHPLGPDRPRRRRSRSRRAAGPRRADPLRLAQRYRPRRGLDHPAALPAHRRRSRALPGRRLARRRRRPYGGMVHDRGADGFNVIHALLPQLAAGVRRPRRAGVTAPRSLPDRLHGHDAAREPGPSPACKSLCERSRQPGLRRQLGRRRRPQQPRSSRQARQTGVSTTWDFDKMH